MKIEQFVLGKCDQVAKFEKYWKRQQEFQPDNFPQEKDTVDWNEPEWDEQFEGYLEAIYEHQKFED